MVLRVGNVTEDGRWAGPQRHNVIVPPELTAFGVETLIVFPDQHSSRFERELKANDIDYRAISLHRPSKDPSIMFRYLTEFGLEIAELVSILRKNDIDVVHVNCPWQIKGALAGKLAGAKVAWHLNDTDPGRLVNLPFHNFAHYLADGFLVASERTRRCYLEGKGLEDYPVQIVHSPVDTSAFDPSLVEPDTRIGEREGRNVVTVANINPAKDLGTLIECAGIVNSRSEQRVNFHIVGPLRENKRKLGEKLKRQAEALDGDWVNFYGASDNVPSVLKASDLYVCSSSNEGSPTVVWEALSMKLPVISTDVSDVRRFVVGSDKQCGFVRPVGDAEGLAEGVLQLLDDERRYREFSTNAREVAIREFDRKACARKYARLYRRILPSSSGRL